MSSVWVSSEFLQFHSTKTPSMLVVCFIQQFVISSQTPDTCVTVFGEETHSDGGGHHVPEQALQHPIAAGIAM